MKKHSVRITLAIQSNISSLLIDISTVVLWFCIGNKFRTITH